MAIIQYIIDFNNKQDDAVQIKIWDLANYDPDGDNPTTYVNLKGIAPALEIETFNTNEDKFSPIIGQRATIRFKSTNAVNFTTFSTGEDYRFWVRVTTGSFTVFTGWLVMEDNQQVYLPPGQPVILTATDNLGSLKDIELSDFDGERPSGKYKLSDIMMWCLAKTEGPWRGWGSTTIDGLKVALNLFENNHDNTNNSPLNQTYVDVNTFEKSLTEYEDCYTVLEKILFSLGCRIAYYNNYWYILRIDEYKNSNFYISTFNAGGTYTAETLGIYLDKLIGENGGATNNIQFIHGDTVQRLQRPYKSVAFKENYVLPDEIPNNSSFEYGDVIDDIPPTRTFALDNWTLLRGEPGAYGTTDSTVYIERTYNALDYIDEKYIVITPQTYAGGLASTDQVYIESSEIEVCIKDKFSASVDWCIPDGSGYGGMYFIMLFLLHGDDNTWWQLGYETWNDPTTPLKWWNTLNFTTVTGTGQIDIDFTLIDEVEWQTHSIENPPPFPVTGKLYIRLHQLNQFNVAQDNKDIRYTNLNFTYIPYINGAYRRYDSASYIYSTSDNYSKKFEEDIYLFDAPCKMYKGAMFYYDTGTYYLTSEWFDRVMLVYAADECLTSGERFVKWQDYAAWNQLRNPTTIINASLFGLDTASGDYASVIHKYNFHFNNAAYPLNNKDFVILSMRQDWHTCQWSATLAEVHFRADSRKQVSEANPEISFNFKYIQE